MAATAVYLGGEQTRIQWTAPSGGAAIGDVVAVRTGATGMVGVVVGAAIGASATGLVAITGKWRITKNTTSGAGVFAIGAIVYLDVADANVSSQASANIKAGIAVAAAAAADTTADVLLIPSKA